jgi:hypothetical protein
MNPLKANSSTHVLEAMQLVHLELLQEVTIWEA